MRISGGVGLYPGRCDGADPAFGFSEPAGTGHQYFHRLLQAIRKGNGEGIVIKNYSYTNKYGRQTWAKIVANEFKEVHAKAMGASIINSTELIEEKIVNKFCTETFIEKEYSKIINEKEGWRSQYIPMLLGRVYSEFIKEETWNFIKEFKNPKVNFKTLNALITQKIKETKSELFK